MPDRKALGPLLGCTAHLARERMDARLSQYDVTPAQTHVLLYLQRGGGEAPQGELTEFLRVKPSTINGILDRMVEKGLVRRTADESDARRKLIALTALGQSKQALFRHGFAEAEEVITRGFSPEETEQFRALLERVVRNLEEDRAQC
ncbi:MAG: MarR family transcriptional regulator [Oscillibacter sp.]